MEFSNGQYRRLKESAKPPLSSSRDQKSFRSDGQQRPPRARTSSFVSNYSESRAISVSPSRGMVPLHLVSSSNVNIPIGLQKKLANSSGKRTALAGILKLTNEHLKIPQSSECSILTTKSSKGSLILNTSKDQLRTAPVKECTFGVGGKENNYVNIYYKQRKLREQIKGNESIAECMNRIQGVGEEFCGNGMDSGEIERRYLKITKDLDKISRNIQLAINKCS